jgi:hypothetical protein
VLVAVGFAALGIAWAAANPPGASPDEPANLVKAYATGAGQIGGSQRGVPAGSTFDDAKSEAWFERADRTYTIPARLHLPSGQVPCFAFLRDESAACSDHQAIASTAEASTTQFGTYQPFLYAPAGLAMQGAPTFASADVRGRLADVLVAAALLGLAAYVTWTDRRSLLSLGGLLLGVTPMVVFLSASVTTNGIEAAAAACAWAALLRLTRREQGRRRAAWAALAIGGSVMVLSRMLDPFFLAGMVAVVWLARSPSSEAKDGRGRDRSTIATASIVVLAVAIGLSLLWTAAFTAHPATSLSTSVHALPTAIKHLPNQLRQAVGIFGWNETTMPQPAYGLWILLTGALVIIALWIGTWRERLALLALGVGVVLADLAIATLVEAPIGFGMQARYILPLTVGIPMFAAELVNRHPEKLGARRVQLLGLCAAGGAIVLQLVAFLVNAHRYAVGASRGWAPTWPSSWAPSGGLLPWLLFAALGAGLLVGAAISAFRSDDRGGGPGPSTTSDASDDTTTRPGHGPDRIHANA